MARAEAETGDGNASRAVSSADMPFLLFSREWARNSVLFAAVGLQLIFLDQFI
jgi:hypothetical protein